MGNHPQQINYNDKDIRDAARGTDELAGTLRGAEADVQDILDEYADSFGNLKDSTGVKKAFFAAKRGLADSLAEFENKSRDIATALRMSNDRTQGVDQEAVVRWLNEHWEK